MLLLLLLLCVCSLLASVSSAVILVTQGTPEPRRANAPKAAAILCQSAARSRTGGSLRTAWPDSCHRQRREGEKCCRQDRNNRGHWYSTGIGGSGICYGYHRERMILWCLVCSSSSKYLISLLDSGNSHHQWRTTTHCCHIQPNPLPLCPQLIMHSGYLAKGMSLWLNGWCA